MSLATEIACDREVAVPLRGCNKFNLFTTSWNNLRSSALSMSSGEVPMIGTPSCSNFLANFNGV